MLFNKINEQEIKQLYNLINDHGLVITVSALAEICSNKYENSIDKTVKECWKENLDILLGIANKLNEIPEEELD